MNIREYIGIANKDCRDALDEEIKDDFENYVFENVWCIVAEQLPTKEDHERDVHNAIDVWFDDVQIMCRTEEIADTIANILDKISGERMAHTGYYDPEEDERSGEVDDHTGWWYVDFD